MVNTTLASDEYHGAAVPTRSTGACFVALAVFLLALVVAFVAGSLCSVLSRGILPQITGYLVCGVVLGPFCANLLKEAQISLIAKPLNQLSLGFIAGAAGMEMYYPELRHHIIPMGLQVFFIVVFTLCICGVGVFVLTENAMLTVPSISMQSSKAARVALSLLAATLMTARSPASAIAVIAELGCGKLRAAKMTLGITVLSDVVVFILFTLMCQLVHVVTQGSHFGTSTVCRIICNIACSILLGGIVGFFMRLVLPRTVSAEQACADGKEHGDRERADDPAIASRRQFLTPCLGLLLVGILWATAWVAQSLGRWSRGNVRLEPLLTCAVASCVCGHDKARRGTLLNALGFWTRYIVLIFFTLAGASLELPGLFSVLGAATVVMLLRNASVATGSVIAGQLSNRLSSAPEHSSSNPEVAFLWMTLIAQAGATLGLVLELEENFGGWGHDFGTFIKGVVVEDQLLGPILCQIGFRLIMPSAQQSTVTVKFGGQLKGGDNKGGSAKA